MGVFLKAESRQIVTQGEIAGTIFALVILASAIYMLTPKRVEPKSLEKLEIDLTSEAGKKQAPFDFAETPYWKRFIKKEIGFAVFLGSNGGWRNNLGRFRNSVGFDRPAKRGTEGEPY